MSKQSTSVIFDSENMLKIRHEKEQMSNNSTTEKTSVEIDGNFDTSKGAMTKRWQDLLRNCEKMAERLTKTNNWQKGSICEEN